MLLARYTVIGGSTCEDLARKISRKLKAGFVKTELTVFPDGEGKITLSSKLEKNTIVVVQSAPPPVDSNLIQILSLAHKAKEHGIKVIVVIPYMGYARQDREFLPGEIITIKVIAKLLRSSGVSRIFVVDIHSKMALKQFRSGGKNVSAVPDLVKHLKKISMRDPLIVSPDSGGAERARQFARQFGSEFIALQKKRDRKTGRIKIISDGLDTVRDRDLVLVDDMISTGGSIIKATEFLKKQKCRRIFVACTHALLINGAERKIREAGVARIISANTVPGTTAVVDVSDTLAAAIRNA